jgi:hypothetical protein
MRLSESTTIVPERPAFRWRQTIFSDLTTVHAENGFIGSTTCFTCFDIPANDHHLSLTFRRTTGLSYLCASALLPPTRLCSLKGTEPQMHTDKFHWRFIGPGTGARVLTSSEPTMSSESRSGKQATGGYAIQWSWSAIHRTSGFE